MILKRCFSIGFIMVTMVACVEDKVNLENDEYVTIVSTSAQVNEGQTVTFSIDSNLDGAINTEWTQESGPKAYIKNKEDNTLTVIAPNVTGNEIIAFSAEVTSGNKRSKTSITEVAVNNTVVKSLTEQPKPNVFSSANYTKHDSKKFDSLGVPLYERDGHDYYYPVSIAAYGYDLYNSYLHYDEGKEEFLSKFLVVAKWLKDNCIYTEYGFCSYRADFELESYKLESDWTTAMGQGQALSVLVAAHYLTGDESYGQVAYDALSAFLYPIEEKGLTADLDGYIWYEEYGSVEMPNHILNGFLFALSGVYDVKRNYDSDLANDVLNVGINSLVNNIHKFDWNFTSRYSYGPLFQLASAKNGPDAYHELHIYQLAWLYNISGEEKIKEYAAKFLAQDMAGIKTFSAMYNISQKILNVDASSTIDSVNYGTERLYDGYWSIRNYWSSYRFPVDLTIQLNDDVVVAGNIQRLVLTSLSVDDLPSSFSIIELSDSGEETILRSDITTDNSQTTAYAHQVSNYKSYTVTYDINIPISTNRLIIRINGTNDGTVRLREIDVQYPREDILEQIIAFYDLK